jgi:hypothetical protein
MHWTGRVRALRASWVIAAGVSALATGSVVGLASPAWAHEERTVGAYHMAVGFGDEPAYAGQENSVQMFLHDAKDRPVTDLGDTLKVDITYAKEAANKLTLAIVPDFEVGEFGIPGDYRAWFYPTQPGDYTFRIYGSIKGQQVDESFTSGPDTFSPVVDPVDVQFPAKVPNGAQLAQRLDREVPRLNAAIQARSKSAKDDASTARTLGIVGIVMGALGLAAGAVALVRTRRSG